MPDTCTVPLQPIHQVLAVTFVPQSQSAVLSAEGGRRRIRQPRLRTEVLFASRVSVRMRRNFARRREAAPVHTG